MCSHGRQTQSQDPQPSASNRSDPGQSQVLIFFEQILLLDLLLNLDVVRKLHSLFQPGLVLDAWKWSSDRGSQYEGAPNLLHVDQERRLALNIIFRALDIVDGDFGLVCFHLCRQRLENLSSPRGFAWVRMKERDHADTHVDALYWVWKKSGLPTSPWPQRACLSLIDTAWESCESFDP